jgi:hypothetical protein
MYGDNMHHPSHCVVVDASHACIARCNITHCITIGLVFGLICIIYEHVVCLRVVTYKFRDQISNGHIGHRDQSAETHQIVIFT